MRFQIYDDFQQHNPIYYCARCGGEIYKGNTCYPVNGWQVLCPECAEEIGICDAQPEYAGYEYPLL